MRIVSAIVAVTQGRCVVVPPSSTCSPASRCDLLPHAHRILILLSSRRSLTWRDALVPTEPTSSSLGRLREPTCGAARRWHSRRDGYMRSRRSGHIINMSSIGGYTSSSGWGVYCATKFAVEGISEALSVELAPLGIHATVVEPGYFRTDFLSAQSLSSTAVRIDDYADTVGKMSVFAAAANHQQPGDPQRLAQVIVQLAAARKPPTRLALGRDTVARIEEKHRDVERELDLWRSVYEGPISWPRFAVPSTMARLVPAADENPSPPTIYTRTRRLRLALHF
jgi:hypothetical protein